MWEVVSKKQPITLATYGITMQTSKNLQPLDEALQSKMNIEIRHRMITKLDHSNKDVANQIFTIFQRSYKVEAQLIGTLNFPPLLRSAIDIKNSPTQFYGLSENKCLAAVIEITVENKHLAIDSLTVDPHYFRKGLADKLISYVLEVMYFSQAIVETAVVNIPAINLYKKHGFVEFKRWTPSHGIQKLAMSLESVS
ncbi:MAG: ribosomal protein S18 acetylase RimI-like enzyme [Alteromonadaceae bacterium]